MTVCVDPATIERCGPFWPRDRAFPGGQLADGDVVAAGVGDPHMTGQQVAAALWSQVKAVKDLAGG